MAGERWRYIAKRENVLVRTSCCDHDDFNSEKWWIPIMHQAADDILSLLGIQIFHILQQERKKTKRFSKTLVDRCRCVTKTEMTQFSTNETISLEKRVDLKKEPVQTSPEDVDGTYETQRCLQWIKNNDYRKICLQFPDYLLPDSCEVAARLQQRNLFPGLTVYVMGDSAYESCCVDYVTAQHVEADAIIHFGPKCFSEWTDVIPCLCIYDKSIIDVSHLKTAVTNKFSPSSQVTLILDTPYIHRRDDVSETFKHNPRISIVPSDAADLKAASCDVTLYVGSNNRKLLNFRLTFKPSNLYYYDPSQTSPKITDYESDNVILKRRRYLIEKIKDGRTFGIVIGTLVIKNFIDVVERVKRLLKLHVKTYYIISVGRPTVAKLANFPEMDVYVLICCSMSDVYDSRDFYKPIVTPHDVEASLNPGADSDFSYDLGASAAEIDEDSVRETIKNPDVSLLSGRIRSHRDVDVTDDNDKAVALKNDGTVAVGAGHLPERTFKGLEQNLGLTEVKLAEEGRKGIAQRYQNEDF